MSAYRFAELLAELGETYKRKAHDDKGRGMTDEEWRPITGFEGLYSVSSLGRVRRDGPRFSRQNPSGILQPSVTMQGRYKVTLADGRRRRNVLVHTLVAATFLGERPAGLEINHIDGDPHNNAATNLEYVTRAQNRAHAVRLGLDPKGERHYTRLHPERIRRGEQVPTAKLTWPQVAQIRASVGVPQKELARRYGVSRGAISMIQTGRCWTRRGDE